MNINATLLGQMIAFGLFIWFCMKFVWPPLIEAIEQRQKKIAEGLNAAERGVHDLELAQKKAASLLHDAKVQASEILERANKDAGHIVEAAKVDAKVEAERIIAGANAEIDQLAGQVKEQLRAQVVAISLSAAEKVLEREVSAKDHQAVLDKFIAEL